MVIHLFLPLNAEINFIPRISMTIKIQVLVFLKAEINIEILNINTVRVKMLVLTINNNFVVNNGRKETFEHNIQGRSKFGCSTYNCSV